MAIIEATTATFDELINTEDAVVDCYGDFCGACVILEPIYHEMTSDLSGMVARSVGSMGREKLHKYIAEMLCK